MKLNMEVLDDGVATKISAEGMNGEVFCFKKENAINFSEVGLLKVNSVCYVLYSDFYDRNINNNKIYIGQTNSFEDRIKQHCSSGLRWNKGIVIAFNTESHDIIYRMESDLIKLAKESVKYKVENVKSEDRGYVCQCQKDGYDNFLKLLVETLSAINIDVFDRNVDGAFIFRDQANLKAEIVDRDWPCTIRILSGSKAEKGRVPYLDDYFAQNSIKTQKGEHRTVSSKSGKVLVREIEEYVFSDDLNLTFQKDESHKLYAFKNVNGKCIVNYLAD